MVFSKLNDAVIWSKKKTYSRVFSREIAKGGIRNFIGSSQSRFWNFYSCLPNNQRKYYEIIISEVPCRLYFDIEYEKIYNKTRNGIEMMKQLLDYIIEKIYAECKLKVNRQEVIILESSTSLKFSTHLIFHSVIFKHNQECKKFVDLITKDEEYNVFMVYKNEEKLVSVIDLAGKNWAI